jgi:hypothetical protein
VRSELLNNLLISYRWQPIINEELISIFESWAKAEDYQIPDLVFLGNYAILHLI